MIDTVKLYLKSDDFIVENKAKLIIVPPDIDNFTGRNRHGYKLFKNGKGIHEGKKAYYNNHRNGLSVSIKPFNKNGLDYYQPITEIYCYIQFSIPRIIFGDNLYSAKENEVNQSFKLVFKELEEIGLTGDFNKSLLSRIDIFKNVEFEFPIQTYYPVFELLKGKRMRDKEVINREYFRWGNPYHNYCCYDKNAERYSKRLPEIEGNIFRFEYRLLKHVKIQSILRYNTVEDLLKKYNAISPCFYDAFNDLLKYEPNQIDLMAGEDVRNIFLSFKEMGGQWLNNSLLHIGSNYLFEHYEPDTLKNIINEVAGNRMTSSRLVEKLDKLRKQKLMRNIERKSRKTYAQLYKEIKEKVLDETVNC